MNRKKNQLQQFGLCLSNEGYAVSLEVGKVYRVIRDDDAAVHGYIRVIDESGEDYAYTTDRFHLIQLPIAVEIADNSPNVFNSGNPYVKTHQSI